MAQAWQLHGGVDAETGLSSMGWGQPGQAPSEEAEYGRLRSVEDLPQAFRPVFSGGFKYFNAIQSECFREVAEAPINFVLAAPTGSGKTVILELAILQLLSRNIDAAGSYAHQPGCLKAVYLAPARALVQEKTRDWTERFGKALGVTVNEVTGDTDIHDLDGLDTTDIICTTPEKFDAMTRRHRSGGMRFFNEIALVMIDEVHLLAEKRGSSLEAGVVSRIKMVSQLREMREQPIAKVRFVAVSATIPNIRDIAAWLNVPSDGIKQFGEEMRPVKLRTVVRGYNPTKTDFLFERRLSDHITGVVAEFSKGRPTLVFCSSRKGSSDTAQQMAKEAVQQATGGRPSIYIRDVAHHQRLLQASADLKNSQLKECIKSGVAFHHAALDPAERAAVERLFLNLDILVLCTTSTLAMGVNLPAHLVVIKGTRRYIGAEAEDASGYQEYERSTCLQMVGRAGRPQFDTEGVAVVMTHKQNVPRYEQLVAGSETVESSLKDMLPEFLNAEITLRTISDVSQAIQWLKGTFFYTRVRCNPAYYGIPRQVLQSVEALDRWVKEKLLLATIQELAKHGMVRTDEDGFVLEPLQPGIIMAEHYMRMQTMVLMASSPPGSTIPDLINIVARSTELSNVKLRRSEKKQLNELNHSAAARYHVMHASKAGKVMERISTAEHKIFILVNTALADQQPGDKLEYSLRQEMDQVVTVGARIAGAMIKYYQHCERASETFNSYLLQKNCKQRMWTDSQYETRQLPGVGPLISERLAAAGLTKLQQLSAVDPRRLESITQRHYPFGTELQDALRSRLPPTVELQISPLGRSGTMTEVEVTVVRVEGTGNDSIKSRACLLVGALPSNKLLACRPLCLETFPSPLKLRLKASMPKGTVAPLTVVASVVHERLVGVDVAVSAQINNGSVKQQQQQQTPTSLLDRSPDGSMASDEQQGTEADGAGPTGCSLWAAAQPAVAGPAAALRVSSAAAATLEAVYTGAGSSTSASDVALAGEAEAPSEARKFMSLQQVLQRQRSKVLVGAGAGVTATAGPVVQPAARVQGVVSASRQPTQGQASRLQQVQGSDRAMAIEADVAFLKPAVPAAAGSRWRGFLATTGGGVAGKGPTSCLASERPACTATFRLQGTANVHTVPLQQDAPRTSKQPPPAQQEQAVSFCQGEQQSLGSTAGGAGLFSQFMCSKAGAGLRDSLVKRPPVAAQQLQQPLQRQPQSHAPPQPSVQTEGNTPQQRHQPDPAQGERPPEAGLQQGQLTGILPQKRKLVLPSEGKSFKVQPLARQPAAETYSAALGSATAAPNLTSFAAPNAPQQHPKPAAAFKVPVLPFLRGRWGGGQQAGAGAAEQSTKQENASEPALVQAQVKLPDVDMSVAFSFL